MPGEYCRTECEAAAEAQEGGSGCNAVQRSVFAGLELPMQRLDGLAVGGDDGHSTTASLIKIRKSLYH